MSSTDTTTLYAVARGTDVITGYRKDVATAQSDLNNVLTVANSIGITDTVTLVQVDITTTTSDPTPYVAPAPEVVEEAAPEETPAPTTPATTGKTSTTTTDTKTDDSADTDAATK